MKQRYPHLLSFLSDLKKNLYLSLTSVLLSVVYVLASLKIPLLIGSAIDSLISPENANSDSIAEILIHILILTVISGLFHYLSSLLTNRLSLSFSTELRKRCFVHLQRLPLSFIDTHPVGELLDRIISDIEIISEGLQLSFSQLIIGVTTVLGIAVNMLKLDRSSLVIVVILTPLSLLLTKYLAKKTHHFYEAQSRSRASESAYTEELLSAFEINKAYQHEQISIESFNKLDDQFVSDNEKSTFFSSLTNPSTRLLNNVIYSLIAFVGAYLCLHTGGSFTIGQYSSLLSFASQFGKPFNDISSVVTELQNAINSIEHVYDFLGENEESPDPEDAIKDFTASGLVELNDIEFSYNKDTSLIRDFSVTALQGHHIAIVGPTGCGKTTIINLLMRFYDPISGTIALDHLPSAALTRDALRSNFGMVLQDTWIKTATVKENLSFSNPGAPLETIVRIAKKTHADDFISILPLGYDTLIGEEGLSLSEGQRQLLCITRLFLTLPPIIILDEATSSIDTKTERDIFLALDELLDGRTSFIVAHRLSTIENADTILVMKDGRLIEQGTHRSLLETKGFYYNLYTSQYHLDAGLNA